MFKQIIINNQVSICLSNLLNMFQPFTKLFFTRFLNLKYNILIIPSKVEIREKKLKVVSKDYIRTIYTKRGNKLKVSFVTLNTILFRDIKVTNLFIINEI